MVRDAPDGTGAARYAPAAARGTQASTSISIEHPRVGELGDDHRRVDRADVAERLAVRAGEAVEVAGVDR